MTHEKTAKVIKRFMKEAQDFMNKIPGIVSVSIDAGQGVIVITNKKHRKC